MMAHKLTGMAALAAALLASPAAAQDTAVPPADIAAVLACEPGAACETSLPVKIVIVSLFEIGEDEGDVAGEFQLWRERRGLDVRIPFPQGFHDLYYNPETQVLGMVTGIGTARSSASGMALGLDYGLTHSCYDPDDHGRPCGRCDSCRLRARGFEAAGVIDPALPLTRG